MAALLAALAFAATLTAALAMVLRRPDVLRSPGRVASELAEAAAVFATPEGEDQRDAVAVDLVQAGFGPRAASRYFAVRVGLSLGVPLVALATWRPDGIALTLVVVSAGAATGYLIPLQVVTWRRNRRQAELRSTMPAMLDLLVPCLEAGLPLEVSLARVVRELRQAGPAMCDEFDHLLRNLRAGVPRGEALRELGTRAGVQELDALADALARSERGGLGLTQTLRQLGQEVRTVMLLDAERRAATAGPALTVAMIVFMLPLFLTVLVGPAALQVLRLVSSP